MMHFMYICEKCGKMFAAFDAEFDETKFGFDCLTTAEYEAIIEIDPCQNTVAVKSVCDACLPVNGEKEAGMGGFLN